MECLNKCEFQEFEKGYFKCVFYDKRLTTGSNVLQEDKVVVNRCDECVNEDFMGANNLEESIKKIKQRLGFCGDSFYSFKDEFETELTEIYRILKKLDKKANKKDEKLKVVGEE